MKPNTALSVEVDAELVVDKEEKEEIKLVYVDIKGAVEHPNVYEIESDKKVIVAMGSVCETIKETVDYLVNNKNEIVEKIDGVIVNGKIMDIENPVEIKFSLDIEKVIINNGITTIGENAFSYCHAIEDITLPKSLDEIGVAAFWECENLTEVTIPYNVTNIGVNAFGSYIKNFNGNFATKDGRCLIVDNSLVCFANACGVTKYTIPDNATTIKKDVIRCNSLTEITIPNSVTTIENGAFFSCSNIERFNGKFATNDGKCLIVNDNLAAFAQGCGATEYARSQFPRGG